MAVAHDLQRLVAHKLAVIYPTVLLSIVDHHKRVAKGSTKRVVGTLLGTIERSGKIHVTNSFAVPFEEDATDSTVWFLDHSYNASMYYMFRKINRTEEIVGWYSTAGKMKTADIHINETYRKSTPNPLCLIVNVHPEMAGLPFESYLSYEEPSSDAKFRKTFVRVASTIGAVEAEEVGVEHLLRDIKGTYGGSIGAQTKEKIDALKLLSTKLSDMVKYINEVINGDLPLNPRIVYNLQSALALIPAIETDGLIEAVGSLAQDAQLAIYLGSVSRLVLTMHDLIDNKLADAKRRHDRSKKETKSLTSEATTTSTDTK
eukprot:GHVO01064611.1.p1 GENE.GHVO01064611.1~~GHVO01064611.1.p1  ORF type:complete len:326 (+),score=37.56 GHVO01064611.1:33-980(+)